MQSTKTPSQQYYISRKEYFRKYYLENKNKKRTRHDITDPNKKQRGRPRKIQPPFKIQNLSEPITLTFK
jgi:hypothetical protein